MGSIGLMCSRYATEVWHLYITYGVIGGKYIFNEINLINYWDKSHIFPPYVLYVDNVHL